MANKIKYIDRNTGNIIEEVTPSAGFLNFLYQTYLGRLPLYFLLKRKLFSSFLGIFMDLKLSRIWVPKFIGKHEIDMDEAVLSLNEYKTFNEFFYRKLKPESRKIGEGIVSPADGKIIAFEKVNQNTEFFVKGSSFCLKDFVKDGELAKKFENGAMLIIRLAPTDYHRFHFPAEGVIGASQKIKGHYYSVSPLALKKSLRIFCQNKREHSLLHSQSNGNILISEVGATLVGSIIQTYQNDSKVMKGQEKGYFAFGGSTLVMFFEEGKINISEDILENTKKGFETSVQMGETIGS